MGYLRGRGVSDEDIETYDIRWHQVMQAVVFPIKRDGLVYGWQARKVNPTGKIRLITAKRFDKGKFFLNWDNTQSSDRLVVVEGPFDCVGASVPRYGAIAALGKGITLNQIALILSHPAKDVYLGLDDDAFNEVYSVAKRLSGKNIFRALVSGGKDFGDLCGNKKEAQRVLDSSKRMSSTYLEVFFKD
jgi:DNA primase